MTIKTVDAYGTMIEAVVASPELLTAPQAAKQIGRSTQIFNKVARRNEITGWVVAGTEKNKFPAYVYSPESVAKIAEILATR